MDFLVLVGVIVLFFWLNSLSKRLTVIESRLNINQTQVAQQPVQPFAQQNVQIVDDHKPVVLEAPSGLQKPVSSINANQWLTIIGVLALLFGMGFFLKYAIDQGWVSEWMRVGIGLLVGGLLIILGELWKNKYAKYAQYLSAGGVGLLYFSVYASFQYYNLIQESFAFVALIVVTLLGVFLASRYNSKGMAALALTGAYLAPLLILGYKNHQISYLLFLTLVNLGVLALLVKYSWFDLLFLALFGNTIIFGLWLLPGSTQALEAQSMMFLGFNFLVMLLTSLISFRKFHQRGELQPHVEDYVGIFTILSSIAVFIASIVVLDQNYHSYLSATSALFGVIVLLGYALVDRMGLEKLNHLISVNAALFLISACYWQFSGFSLSTYWLLLGLLGVGVGLGVGRKDLRTWGLVSIFCGTVQAFTFEYDLTNMTFLLNVKFINELITMLVLLGTGWVYAKYSTLPDELKVMNFMKVVVALLLWFAVSWELVIEFRGQDASNLGNLLISLWWIVYAMILTGISFIKGHGILRKTSIVLFVVAILKVFTYDILALQTGYKIVSFVTLGVLLLIVSFIYQKHKGAIQEFIKAEDQK